MSETIEEKLAVLEISEKDEDSLEILRKCSTPEELKGEFRARQFSCDVEQFLIPIFRLLYLKNEEVRKSTIQRLKGLGISNDLIHNYFTIFGYQPYMRLAMRYGEELGHENCSKFVMRAEEVMLDELKKYLGF